MKSINIKKIIKFLSLIIFAVSPVFGDWASAESADFTVNTVPEPGTIIVLAGIFLLTLREFFGNRFNK